MFGERSKPADATITVPGAAMNYKQLEAIVYLARHGTFRKAAETLYFDSPEDGYITPESIQYRLKQLEAELGVSLYRKRRGSSRVQLTREGQLFLREAVDVYQRMREWNGLFLETRHSILTFGTTQAVIIHRLIPTIGEFRKGNPQVRLRILNLSDEALETDVLSGKLDFAFAVRTPDSSDLEYVLWKRSRLVLITPKNHPLGKRSEIQLRDLVTEPLIVLNPDVRGDRDTINRAFLRAGEAQPNIVIEASNSEIIAAMVEAGLGLGITSATSMTNQPRALCSVPVVDLTSESEVGLLIRRGQYLNMHTRKFLSMLDPFFEKWVSEHAEMPEDEDPEEE